MPATEEIILGLMVLCIVVILALQYAGIIPSLDEVHAERKKLKELIDREKRK